MSGTKHRFGTTPVLFTALSTILGAILFLRFGMAVGHLGFWGAITIIILGHIITIPTALAISEISTNTRVEGGGEYFIISRSFGMNIGATIGLALYFSQAISIAFYVIAFTEAFEPLFNWFHTQFNTSLPRQVISIPALLILAYIVLEKGSNMGLKTLYIIIVVLFLALVLFFLGQTDFSQTHDPNVNFVFRNKDNFFVWFAICFPAFTGMTAGVGLSGDLKNPAKSIPRGTLWGTAIGMIIYVALVYKFSISLPPDELSASQLAMADIAVWGVLIIPLGLGASTISSAIGSILVAPRTLQALASDKNYPGIKLNQWLQKGIGKSNEPYNSTLITIAIALIFVTVGEVDFVARIITMFFLITYGSLCLISFLNHFGASPSYRPKFRSHWLISITGFLLSVWVMFKIDSAYTFLAYLIIILTYTFLNHYHKERGGLQNIFQGALFQLSRRIQLYLQKNNELNVNEDWRPSAICISSNSFRHTKIFSLMKWISYKHGFGSYFHFLKGYYSKTNHDEAGKIVKALIEEHHDQQSSLYVNCMISPSYTTAIAQAIQSPSISGMENNMVIFECRRDKPEALEDILDNISLIRAGDYDVCILSDSNLTTRFKNGIHIWIRPSNDSLNGNLMIMLGFIILSHPDWRKGYVKIFSVCHEDEMATTNQEMRKLVQSGRLPVTMSNIVIVPQKGNESIKTTIHEYSSKAGLTIVGFREESVKHSASETFMGYEEMGDMLFVNASQKQNIC